MSNDMTNEQMTIEIAKLIVQAGDKKLNTLHAIMDDASDLADKHKTAHHDLSNAQLEELNAQLSVGFSGTQRGMSQRQKDNLTRELKQLREKGCTTFHHGDCIGADGEAHKIALELGYRIVIHPPSDMSKALNTKPSEMIAVLPPKPYLERNKDIVIASMILLAAPYSSVEQKRSGTWSTIRFARTMASWRKSRIQILMRGPKYVYTKL
jgi:hypothetical protein